MAITLEQFIEQIRDSGVVSTETLIDFIPPKASPKSAEELATELIRQKKLTKFQAEEISRGRGKSLILGNYVVLQKIGEGGMGAVFKARHKRMDRVVAIKVLPTAMTKDAMAIARFEREVKAAAKLEHPNIVAAHDADEANGVHFLVMQYVEGADLSAQVKKNGPFSVPLAVNFILQAARGLQFAHGEGIVHRDIKPANLLLDKKGTVKILDMGLARLHGDGDGTEQADLTSTGTIMGTIDYMSPEQAMDTKSADARADVYALGCSLYYLLTGQAVYRGDTMMKRLMAHRESPIPSLRSTSSKVPESLERIFKKMVAKELEDRYQSMHDVIHDLLECQGQLPTFSEDFTSPTEHLSASSPSQTLVTQPPASVTEAQPHVTEFVSVVDSAAEATMLTGDNLQLTNPQMPTTGSGSNRPKRRNDSSSPSWWKNRLLLGSAAGGLVVVALIAALALPPKPRESIVAGNSAVTETRTLLAFEKPGFDAWVEEVQKMPAEQQIDAVSKKLMELNPDFDGKLYGYPPNPPVIDNGIATVVTLSSDNLADVLPLRAFKGLSVLICSSSSSEGGRLANLSPLHGMSINFLSCGNNPGISDLQPLKGMPLKILDCAHSQVSDLTPLVGMKLEDLSITATSVKDLTPLAGMPLKRLSIDGTAVTDLSPVKDLPLENLALMNTRISDFSPLTGMKTLRELGLSETEISEIPPLSALDLESLNLSGTKIKDLSPLQGLKLRRLFCPGLAVTSLESLRGMPLKDLWIWQTEVSDLSPLEGMRLNALRMDGTKVFDLSPLEGMELNEISLTPKNITKGMEVLRNMKTLKIMGTSWADNVSPDEFWKKYDAGDFGKPEPPSKSITDFNSPAFVQWVKETHALTPEKQVEAVRKKLKELNPGFDGKMNDDDPERILNSAVFRVAFQTDHVSDITPLRALKSLKQLSCPGSSPGRGQLADLSPLKGMLLNNLWSSCNPGISDLRPLAEMPLGIFDGSFSQVSDLTPLAGMILVELNLSDTPVKDLTPLAGTDLRHLKISGTAVTDLSPIRKLRLESLHAVNTSIKDLSPIRGMPLKQLMIGGTAVSDLSPVRDAPLEVLAVQNTPITDISPLSEMKALRSLSLTNLNISEIPRLLSLDLKGLDIGATQIKDLSPLRGLKLIEFFSESTPISSLESLRGMPLTTLHISHTEVSDLSPIQGMRLQLLRIDDTKVSDLSPIEGMELTVIALTPKNITKGMEVLRNMNSLKTIATSWENQFSPDEFWKKYDAGEFGKPE